MFAFIWYLPELLCMFLSTLSPLSSVDSPQRSLVLQPDTTGLDHPDTGPEKLIIIYLTALASKLTKWAAFVWLEYQSVYSGSMMVLIHPKLN